MHGVYIHRGSGVEHVHTSIRVHCSDEFVQVLVPLVCILQTHRHKDAHRATCNAQVTFQCAAAVTMATFATVTARWRKRRGEIQKDDEDAENKEGRIRIVQGNEEGTEKQHEEARGDEDENEGALSNDTRAPTGDTKARVETGKLGVRLRQQCRQWSEIKQYGAPNMHMHNHDT